MFSRSRFASDFGGRTTEFLASWAAGNDGDLGLFTIGSPATAKNILCVGAQQSTMESLMLETSDTTFITLSAENDELEKQKIMAKWASFGNKGEISGSVVIASQIEACQALSSTANGKIVLVARGTCAFTTKASNVQVREEPRRVTGLNFSFCC